MASKACRYPTPDEQLRKQDRSPPISIESASALPTESDDCEIPIADIDARLRQLIEPDRRYVRNWMNFCFVTSDEQVTERSKVKHTEPCGVGHGICAADGVKFV